MIRAARRPRRRPHPSPGRCAGACARPRAAGRTAARVAHFFTALALSTLLAQALPAAGAERSSPESEDWTCRGQVCQRVSQRGNYLTLELQSRRPAPCWVVLEPHGLTNVKALQATPFTVRLEPGQTRTAGVLTIEDAAMPHRYQTKWRVLAGNPNAIHDDRWHYRMPFGGSHMVPISQGYNGRFSHKGASAYALDFPMPWGTPILASRGGTIVEVINDKVASGIRTGESEGDNRVVIEHLDGTFAVYAHLRHGGPARVGQRVQSGELIGLSGDTGFSTGPHLHFEVYKIGKNGQRQSIPVKFWNGTKAGFTPLAGLQYKPGCPRDGGEMCMPGELASEPGLKPAGPARALPAAQAPGASSDAQSRSAPAQPRRREDGACLCPNGATLHVDLPCELVCGR
ncbi:MAG: M23 family metallopeptidase [Myxococcota bacterium]